MEHIKNLLKSFKLSSGLTPHFFSRILLKSVVFNHQLFVDEPQIVCIPSQKEEFSVREVLRVIEKDSLISQIHTLLT